MNKAQLAAREKFKFKLIELVKPHDILYRLDRKNDAAAVSKRRELWSQITMEMNQTFNLNWGERNYFKQDVRFI